MIKALILAAALVLIPASALTKTGNPPGWPFSFSCETAKWYASQYTPAQLEAMRKQYGFPPLTASQRRIMRQCISGKW